MALARSPGMHTRRSATAASGFTLIEVVVVLTVMVIFMLIALPSFRTWVVQQQLQSAVAQVEADLRLARMTAINENGPATIRFQAPPGNAYEVFIDDGAGGGTARNLQRDGGETLVVSRTLDHGIVFSAVDFNGGVAMSFNGRGLKALPATGLAQVVLENRDGTRYRIRVSPAGSIDVSRL